MLYKFKVEPTGEGDIFAKVTIDGQAVRCRGYNIRHVVDEIPTVELEICAIPDYEHDVIVHVGNKEEIARLMDKKEFEEFCEIWRGMNICEEK